MSWKGIVKVTFPSHLQTLMALFPKSKVLKGLVSRSEGPILWDDENKEYVTMTTVNSSVSSGAGMPAMDGNRHCSGSRQVCVKARFHEMTNHADEREKTADDQRKLIGLTDLIGRTTNVACSFH